MDAVVAAWTLSANESCLKVHDQIIATFEDDVPRAQKREIVLAVNVHDDLVAACQAALYDLDFLLGHDSRVELKAALQKAGAL